MNSLWKGLGYYSRAARLLSGAKKVVDELGGRLPDNAKDMESKIPGVGRYSAGAICSIAYNECVPVVCSGQFTSVGAQLGEPMEGAHRLFNMISSMATCIVC